MKLEITSLALVSVFLPTSSALAQAPEFTNSGNSCVAYNGSDAGSFIVNGTLLERKADGAGNKEVVCPIAVPIGGVGHVYADLRLARVGGTMTCTLQGTNSLGNLIGTPAALVFNGGASIQSFALDTATPGAVSVLLKCSVPQNGQILYYKYHH